MRYDRPVRELLVECCRELPEPFGLIDVVGWFAQHHPDVAVTTVRTQFHAQLGRGGLGIVRVARGAYRRTALGVSAEKVTADAPAPQPVAPTIGRVLLLGCVKTKAPTPTPARSLYLSPLWQRRLAHAEASGAPWFVLSAKHGVVDPDDVIAPYDLSLRTASSSYRAAWGAFVAQQLAARLLLRGRIVEVHAGDPYVDAIRGPLARQGAVVDDPVDGDSMGATLAWYDNPPPARPTVEATVPAPIDVLTAAAVAALADPAGVTALEAIRTAPAQMVDRPGLYSWWVDADGARVLSRGLDTRVDPCLIYAGQAGASRSGGTTSSNTLRGRILGMHLGGSRGMSTLRLTLSVILDHAYRVIGGEDELTAWMFAHLTVALWPTDDRESLRLVERSVLRELDPPLNLQHMDPSPVRKMLSELRQSSG